MDIQQWDRRLKQWQQAYFSMADAATDVTYEKGAPATDAEIAALEAKLGAELPVHLREALQQFSSNVFFTAYLPQEIQLPDALGEIFSATIDFSLDTILETEEKRKEWAADSGHPDAAFWNNKLGVIEVPNGDCIAIDLCTAEVVYLSREGGEGHGYILGQSFTDYLDRLIAIGAVGSEDWQMMPFLPDAKSGLDPQCSNARQYRAIMGILE